MTLRWYSNVATDRIYANRLYDFVFETTLGASVQLLLELRNHGRVVMHAPNQTGTSAAQDRYRTRVVYVFSESVSSRGDTLGVLYAQLKHRLGPSTKTITARAAQVTPGARATLWEAGTSAFSASRLEELAAPTYTERAQEAAQGAGEQIAGAAGQLRDGLGSAFDAAGEAARRAQRTAENTVRYAKIALGLVGAYAAFTIVKGLR